MHVSSNRGLAKQCDCSSASWCFPGKTRRWKAEQVYFTYLNEEVETSLRSNYACTSEREYLVQN